MKLLSYKDLEVWKKSMELVKLIYILTKKLPKEELYGLVSQMRRSAVSIPSNIAEGQSRKSSREFIQFLTIARGSKSELETLLYITKELYPIDGEEIKLSMDLLSDIGRMINGLISSIADKANKSVEDVGSSNHKPQATSHKHGN